MIEVFANKKITFALMESFPKEKTALLGTAELSLYTKYLNYHSSETVESIVPECELLITQNLPVTFLNQKSPMDVKLCEISVEISLSRALIDPVSLQNGVFAKIIVEDMYPVPEEWSLKEGNEKDLNSSLFWLMQTCILTP